MTDELDHPVPDGDQDWLRASDLESVWFLDPASPHWSRDELAMPEEVWARLSDSVREQAIERSAVSGAVPITSAAGGAGFGRGAHGSVRTARRGPGWLIGSVAAGVALLGVGIAVQSVQSSRELPVVAGAPQMSPPARGVQPVAEAAPLLASTTQPPARRVLASGTDYQPQTLRSQVVDLLAGLGATGANGLANLPAGGPPTVGTSGFTASLPGLRACITGLTQSEVAQALIVDRASFGGDDAGLVVVPDGSPSISAGEPIATAQTPSGSVDIWIVEPDCSSVDPGVILHLLHQVAGQ